MRRNFVPLTNYSKVYHLNSLKAYQIPNLLDKYPARITADTSHSLPGYEAENLIRNLSSRSCGNDLQPLIDSYGHKATHKSCYRVSDVQLKDQGHILVLGVDLGVSVTQHAILIVEDM